MLLPSTTSAVAAWAKDLIIAVRQGRVHSRAGETGIDLARRKHKKAEVPMVIELDGKIVYQMRWNKLMPRA